MKKIVIVLVVLIGGSFLVFKNFKNKVQGTDSGKTTVFNASPGPTIVINEKDFEAGLTSLPSGPTESKVECQEMNEHVLCRLFKMDPKNEEVVIDHNKLIIRGDATKEFNRAKEMMKDLHDDREIWFFAMGLFLEKRLVAGNMLFANNFSFFGKLHEKVDGKIKSEVLFIMPPGGVPRLENFYSHEIRKMLKTGDAEKFIKDSQKWMKVVMTTVNFEPTQKRAPEPPKQ